MHSETPITPRATEANYAHHVPCEVAVFDLDGTLTVRDAVVPFLLKAGGFRRAALKAPKMVFPLMRAWIGRDRDRAKSLATSVVLSGLSMQKIESAAASISNKITSGWMREDVLARLRWHQSAGHRTVIVSASYDNYVKLVGEALGVDHVIATEIAFDESGSCTGELVGGNCRGQAKADRLTKYLSECGIDCSISWCYGDSSGDHAMMELARNAVMVRAADIEQAPVEEVAQ